MDPTSTSSENAVQASKISNDQIVWLVFAVIFSVLNWVLMYFTLGWFLPVFVIIAVIVYLRVENVHKIAAIQGGRYSNQLFILSCLVTFSPILFTLLLVILAGTPFGWN